MLWGPCVLRWSITLLYSISICIQELLVSLRLSSQGSCGGERGCAIVGFFKIGPPRQLPVLCCMVFVLQAAWSLLRQRFFFPFWDLFSFLFFFFFPDLGESAFSRFELPWGEFCGCLPVAMGGPTRASWSKSTSCLLQERRLQEQSLSLSGSFGFTTAASHKDCILQLETVSKRISNSAGSKKSQESSWAAHASTHRWVLFPPPHSHSAEHSNSSRACEQQEEAVGRPHMSQQVFIRH